MALSVSSNFSAFMGEGKRLLREKKMLVREEGCCLPTYPHDFGGALGTGWGKELLITPLAVNVALLLHKAHVCQGGLAVGTVELFWVPGAPHSYQKGAPGKQRTAPTKAAPRA